MWSKYICCPYFHSQEADLWSSQHVKWSSVIGAETGVVSAWPGLLPRWQSPSSCWVSWWGGETSRRVLPWWGWASAWVPCGAAGTGTAPCSRFCTHTQRRTFKHTHTHTHYTRHNQKFQSLIKHWNRKPYGSTVWHCHNILFTANLFLPTHL